MSKLVSARLHRRFAVLLCTMLACLACSVAATEINRRAQVPPPQDLNYPGVIKLHVDASDTTQGIFRVHESIPVKSGPLVLLYPKWIPGGHAPTSAIANFAGLEISAGGKRLPWQRDEYDVYALHITVPQGVKQIEARFQYLSPREGGFEMTDRMLMLEWNKLALYPAGHFSRNITVEPSVSLPEGWQFGSALRASSRSGNSTTFHKVTFNDLVDSPIYAGKYFKRVDLAPGAAAPVHLDLVADDPKYLAMTDQQLKVHRALVAQATRLFASHHYDHYDFLLSLSDHLAGNGLEHKQSSENGMGTDYFTAWDSNAPDRDLLAHEFTHSWNGKFRRPADLWTPNFNVPMGDSLLWVYEGLTQYYGFVLTARSGIWTAQEFRDALAMVAAKYQRNRPGFQWRTLEDTTNDPTAAHRRHLPYRSWQMSEEYYGAGQMIWLAVDARLRALTHGRKSLDDFAQAFYGMDNGSHVTSTYTFDDVVKHLNQVAPHDWAKFLRQRVNRRNPPVLDGLADAGWKLVYTDTRSAYQKQSDTRGESARHMYNFIFSIGLAINKQDVINDVLWDGPAFKAGVSTGEKLIAVNGKYYSREVLDDALKTAVKSRDPVRLTLKYQGRVHSVDVDYHDGPKYPHLERIKGKTDYLDAIMAPRM